MVKPLFGMKTGPSKNVVVCLRYEFRSLLSRFSEPPLGISVSRSHAFSYTYRAGILSPLSKEAEMATKTLYVGNLPYSASASDIETYFSAYNSSNARLIEGR